MVEYLKCQNCKVEEVEIVYCEELGKWICDSCRDGFLAEKEEREKQDKINKEYFPKSLPKGRYVHFIKS